MKQFFSSVLNWLKKFHRETPLICYIAKTTLCSDNIFLPVITLSISLLLISIPAKFRCPIIYDILSGFFISIMAAYFFNFFLTYSKTKKDLVYTSTLLTTLSKIRSIIRVPFEIFEEDIERINSLLTLYHPEISLMIDTKCNELYILERYLEYDHKFNPTQFKHIFMNHYRELLSLSKYINSCVMQDILNLKISFDKLNSLIPDNIPPLIKANMAQNNQLPFNRDIFVNVLIQIIISYNKLAKNCENFYGEYVKLTDALSTPEA